MGISVVNDVTSIIVHGADFYELLYAGMVHMARGDYHAAGATMGVVVAQLSAWTGQHLCTSPMCYVISGSLQYLSDLRDDPVRCVHDFQWVYGNFSSAYHTMVHSQKDSPFSFVPSRQNVSDGVHDIGLALMSMAEATVDCHLSEFASVFALLGAQ